MHATAFPNAIVAHAWFDREDSAEILAAQAARPLVQGHPFETGHLGVAGRVDCRRQRNHAGPEVAGRLFAAG